MRKVVAAAVVAIGGVLVTTVGCGTAAEDREARNERLVREAFAATAAGKLEAMDELVAEDFVRHCQATPNFDVRSREQFWAYLRADHEVFPDQTIEVVHLVAQGDLVAFWAVFRGTQLGSMGPFPATAKAVELDISGVFRIEDGTIAETWLTWDNLSLLTQLGHLGSSAAAAAD